MHKNRGAISLSTLIIILLILIGISIVLIVIVADSRDVEDEYLRLNQKTVENINTDGIYLSQQYAERTGDPNTPMARLSELDPSLLRWDLVEREDGGGGSSSTPTPIPPGPTPTPGPVPDSIPQEYIDNPCPVQGQRHVLTDTSTGLRYATVYTPPNYDPSHIYNVIYHCSGLGGVQNANGGGNNDYDNINDTGMRVWDWMNYNNDVEPFIVVGVSRVRGSGGEQGEAPYSWNQFKDVVNLIDSTWPVSTSPSCRLVTCFSNGSNWVQHKFNNFKTDWNGYYMGEMNWPSASQAQAWVALGSSYKFFGGGENGPFLTAIANDQIIDFSVAGHQHSASWVNTSGPPVSMYKTIMYLWGK